MSVRIAHASIDERGKIKDGVDGDQTKKEVCIRDWWAKGWNCVVRFKDSAMREKVAIAMEHAAANDNIGYNQNRRNTLYSRVKTKGYDPALVVTACATDCSALVSVACMYAGVKESAVYVNGNCSTTTTLMSRLKATGLVNVYTSSAYLSTSDNLMRGDIIIKTGSHVVVALDNGKNIKSETKTVVANTTPNTTKYTVVTGDTLSKIGAKFNIDWKLIANANGIKSPYTITVGQKLTIPCSNVSYYPKYNGTSDSITVGLKAVGETDISLSHRKEIAVKNNISNYSGTASQNLQMLKLLKQGLLIK